MSNPYANPYASNYGASSNPSNRYGDPYSASTNASSTSINGAPPNPYASSNSSLPASNRDRRGGWGGFGDSTTSLRSDVRSGRSIPPPSNEYNEREDSVSPIRSRNDRPRTPRGYGVNTDRSPVESRSRGGYDAGLDDDRRRRQAATGREYGDASRSRDRPRKANGINGSGGRGYDYGTAGYGRATRPRAKNMEDVLQYIKSDWAFMGGDDCVPVQVALQLMDSSSLGLASREPEFQQTEVDLQTALKTIVNEHHQDFNSSIGTYHKIQASIQNSQHRVRILKNSLHDAKGGLLTTKPELKELATSSQAFDDMLGLFGQIEGIQAIPERLESRLSEKRFLSAVETLQDALRLVRKSELDGIGGISDLQTYFSNQEASILDILIEELHDHLYLKSPYCQDRWKALTPDAEKDSKDEINQHSLNAWDKPMYQYLANLDVSNPMVDDASKNPEADTFYYIHMILEALSRLGQLEAAVYRIEQRMPLELFAVVDKTNSEIDNKYPSHNRGQTSKEKRRLTMPSEIVDGRTTVVSDFLWTVFAKFEAIAEGHRVLHDVVVGIIAREKTQKPEKYTGGLKELWKLYQSEMRSLLHDYLATDGDVTLRAGVAHAESANVFSKAQRDKNKRMFKLSEMDQKSADMKSEQDELDEILKSSVPGLTSKTRAGQGLTRDVNRAGQDATATGHKLLIEPSVFNITFILPPSLSFLQHLKDIVPVTSDIAMSTLTSFLDDFLINVFHPQLEEAVTELCTQTIIDMEAFTEDPQWSKVSPRPVFKGTTKFFHLVHMFSRMLTAIPHDTIFTQLIITQMVTYYDKCFGWYKALVTRLASSLPQNTPSLMSPNLSGGGIALKAAAAYAESGEIRNTTLSLWETFITPTPSDTRPTLVEKEINTILANTTSNPLSAYDIISDPKSVLSLSLLYNSASWLCASLLRLRHISISTSSRSRPNSSQGAGGSHNRSPSNPHRWTLLSSLSKPGSGISPAGPTGTRLGGAIGASLRTSQVYIPLTTESANAFDTTLQSFKSLAITALLTLHIDVRCGIIFMLGRTLRSPTSFQVNSPDLNNDPSSASLAPPNQNRDSSGALQTDPNIPLSSYPFILPTPPQSASPGILELNTDLLSFSNTLAAYLGTKERAFVAAGLAALVDEVMVREARMIGCMNRHGAARLGLDLLVLQQNLRSLGPPDAEQRRGSSSSAAGGSGLGIKDAAAANGARDEVLSLSSSGNDATLARANRYYNLFLEGADAILEFARAMKRDEQAAGDKKADHRIGKPVFSYAELKILVDLCFSEALRSEKREVVVKAKKKVRDVGIGLDEALWDS